MWHRGAGGTVMRGWGTAVRGTHEAAGLARTETSVSRRVTMRARGSSGWALWVLALCTGAAAQVLTPPYFNLAENRRITATATCGLDVADPELYCKLVGANADRGASFSDDLIQGGQVS